MKTRTKTWILALVGLIGVIAALVGIKASQIMAMMRAGESFQPPPEAVSAARVESARWERARPAIATLVAVRGVTLASEVPGTVRAIGFESGTTIEDGAVLVELDRATEEAQLRAAQADAALAKTSLKRQQSLRRTEANAAADLDRALAQARQADANVAVLRAALAKKTIRAPFAGRISIRQIELGQVLAPGEPIAALHQVDPIEAELWLPQQALAELRKGQRARLRTDAFPGANWDGEVTTVDTEVDAVTRSVRVRAAFPNRDGRLRHGMYANVEVLADEPLDVLVIPATAVLYAPYGDSVYVLRPGEATGDEAAPLVAQRRFVRLGERRGDFVAVADGLAAGETVASSGAFKLRDGTQVIVSDDPAPDPALAPQPEQP